MKIMFTFLFFLNCSIMSCIDHSESTKSQVTNENKMVTEIKNKIIEFKRAPARVEVRSYLKSADHKFQDDIKLIKKIKTHLNPQSEVYLEINLFTNEQDKNAPLVAQFMWFDIKTKNLVLEENLNLN